MKPLSKIMILIYTFLFLTTILPTQALPSTSTCNCAMELSWVRNTFEKNDAGFEDVLQRKGKQAYDAHNLEINRKAKSIKSVTACRGVIVEWLRFFRKGHFSVRIINEQNLQSSSPQVDSTTIAQHERMEIDEAIFIDKVTQEQHPSPLGVWESAPYKVAIVPIENGYAGVVLDAPGTKWQKGQVKLKLFRVGDAYKANIWMGNFSLNENRKVEFIGNNIIHIEGFSFLNRKSKNFEDTPSTQNYLRSINTTQPFYERLSDNTTYLRIPSFGISQKRLIDSVLLSNDQHIRQSANLIIDLRNNGGGSDAAYQSLIPYLYTNPIRTVGVQFLSTELNNKAMLALSADTLFDEDQRKEFRKIYEKLTTALGDFVQVTDDLVSVEELDSIYPYPKQIAILINEYNASTTEQFLLSAKQSSKVKLYGKTTFGALDISNMSKVTSPSGTFEFWYCTSKSLRIPDMAIDDIGLQPDFYLDSSIPQKDWVDFAKESMHSGQQ